MKRFNWGLLVLVLVMTLGFSAAADKYVKAKFTTTPPTIDGVLDDEIWKQAEKKDDFLVSTGGKPSQKTEFWVAWDRDYLYVAIKNYVNTDWLRQTVTEDNGPTWDDDENSVFINPAYPELASMLQYSFNSVPARNGLAYGGTNTPELDMWEVAIKTEKDFSTAEVKISFESAEIWPEVGDEWGFNIGRNCTSVGEAYSWGVLINGNFIDAAGFGVVEFVK